jgi:EAL domain-containing protein (putative c-di-GMP-specific phosphodiesterase class I)
LTVVPLRACSRCETLPTPPAGPGRLYLWFQDPETLAEAREHVEAYGPQPLEAEGLLLALDGQEAVPLTESLAGHLYARDGGRDGVRLLWISGDREPSLDDYPRVVPLQRFLAVRRSDWLLRVLSGRRLTSHFQPIVHAADTSRVFGHEALLRGLDAEEQPIAPGGLFAAAREADLLFQLDLAARQSAIRQAARHGLEGHLFINFTPNAIYNPTYCLRSTVAAVAEAGIEPERVIFEVIESERVIDLDHLERILGVYRQAGFRIALDDLGAGYSSLALMNRLRPDFVKLDQELTRGVHEDAYKAVIAEELLALARRLDIRSVAEGIEAAGELSWLREHGADYVQGYLIGRPAAEPAVGLPRL